jgi:hypothetical protein
VVGIFSRNGFIFTLVYLATPTPERVKEEVRWSEDELSVLAKALQRYPPGTQNRWKLVNDMLPG